MSADDVKGASSSKGERPPRLYVKGAFVTFRRSNANQRNHCAILQIDGVNNKEDLDFYLGKRVAYIYKAKRARGKHSRVKKESGKQTSRFRVIWERFSALMETTALCDLHSRKIFQPVLLVEAYALCFILAEFKQF